MRFDSAFIPLRHLIVLQSSQKAQQVSKVYNESYYRIKTNGLGTEFQKYQLILSITQPLGTTGKLATFLVPVSQSLFVKWDQNPSTWERQVDGSELEANLV